MLILMSLKLASNSSNQIEMPTISEVKEGAKKIPTSECSSEDLAGLRSDLQRITLPSHIDSPPRNFGSASHGKLKADAWFILTSLVAPITFIRLWTDEHQAKRKGELLQHLINLSQAVWLVSRARQTDATIAEFREYMSKYVTDIPKLFPEKRESVHPNHHMALHIHEYLTAFGPAYSWSCYPCERVIGDLQKMGINGKISTCHKTLNHVHACLTILRRHPRNLYEKLLATPGSESRHEERSRTCIANTVRDLDTKRAHIYNCLEANTLWPVKKQPYTHRSRRKIVCGTNN